MIINRQAAKHATNSRARASVFQSVAALAFACTVKPAKPQPRSDGIHALRKQGRALHDLCRWRERDRGNATGNLCSRSKVPGISINRPVLRLLIGISLIVR